jgi:hypothetical protein
MAGHIITNGEEYPVPWSSNFFAATERRDYEVKTTGQLGLMMCEDTPDKWDGINYKDNEGELTVRIIVTEAK